MSNHVDRRNERKFNLTLGVNEKIDTLATALGVSRSSVIRILVHRAELAPGDGLFGDRILAGPIAIGREDVTKKTV